MSEYRLNPFHPVGKHKVALFKKWLGITVEDAVSFKNEILNHIATIDVVFQSEDNYGKRYIVDIHFKVKIC